MKKLSSLLILVAVASIGVYFLGVYTEIPVSGIIRWGTDHGPGQDLNAQGVAQLNTGNPAGALVSLREARRLDPDNAVISRNLSIALARVAMDLDQDETTAIGLLEESLEIWPRNPEGLDGLSTLYFKSARYKDALDHALVLRELMPENADLAEYVNYLQKRIADEQGMAFEKGDSFRLMYSDRKRLEYEGEIVSILQEHLDSLTAALGIFPGRTIDVLLLTEDLGSRAAPLDPFLEGLYDGQIRLYVGQGIDDREKFIVTVRHEMVHALLQQAAGNLPGWVQEGLAQIAGEQPDREQLEKSGRYLAGKIREGYRIDLSKMGISFINLDSDTRMRAYVSSMLFMEYLSRKYGTGFVPRFVAELASGLDPQEALRTITGASFGELQASFSNELTGKF